MTEDELTEAILRFKNDPLGFVQYVFPWGEPGTILANEDGPDVWQEDILGTIRDEIARREEQSITDAIQVAVSSGHGIGKGACLTWIILWFMSTRINPQIVVTANTKPQLDTKTWREVSKWHQLMINSHWFQWTATKFYCREAPSTWFAAAIPWSEQNSEAFAGTHDENVLVIFDEASAIADIIWEVAEGAMTTSGAMWFAFGNPTQNVGRFAEAFGKLKHRWITRKIDSRTAKKADNQQIQKWIDDYGEDHDFVRVRVRGEFPRAATTQFIPNDIVEYCMHHYRADIESIEGQPIVMGLDIARFGSNQTVFCFRQGRKVYDFRKFRGLDTMDIAQRACAYLDEMDVYVAFVDEGGVGAGVIDRMRQLGYGHKVIAVNSGVKPDDKELYFNKRAEMWARMKEALAEGLEIPQDGELQTQLTAIEYGLTNQQQIQLEKKRDMEKRGVESPDVPDALALTYAERVMPKGFNKKLRRKRALNWRLM